MKNPKPFEFICHPTLSWNLDMHTTTELITAIKENYDNYTLHHGIPQSRHNSIIENIKIK